MKGADSMIVMNVVIRDFTEGERETGAPPENTESA